MLELYIENQLVEVSKELEIPLTYKNTDLSNPQAIKNDYSKTVQIPGTPKNNRIFGHVFKADRINYLGTSLIGPSFNANKRAEYTIINNGSIFGRGYCKLDSISSLNGTITYSLTLYGGLGNFFYNLMYDDNGEEKTLNSLYFGINKLSPSQENNNQLFEYNKNFVVESWNNRINNEVESNEVTKMFCAIPTYSGYYDDFDSNKVIINKLGFPNALSGNRSKRTVTEDSTTKTFEDKSNWVLCDMGTDVSEWELCDIRSHYQRLGIRMKSIYDAIKNPENNGGFVVDDSNVRDIEKKYIDNMYLVKNRFNYEEIGQTGQYIELSGWTHDVTNEYNWDASKISTSSRTMTIEADTSKWLNINGRMVVSPRWAEITQYWKKPAYIEMPFATTFAEGYKSNYAGLPWVTGLKIGKGSTGGSDPNYITVRSCYQYYWVDLLDNSDKILASSPAYMIGMKHSNRGCEDLGEWDNPNTVLGKADKNLRAKFEAAIKERKHGNGSVVWSYSENEWNFAVNENGGLNTFNYYLLLPTGSAKNNMGETNTFTIDLTGLLSKLTKKIRLNSCCISYCGALNIINGSLSDTAKRQESYVGRPYWVGRGNCYYETVQDWIADKGIYFGIGSATYFGAPPVLGSTNFSVIPIYLLEGKSTEASKIYAGESAAADDSHIIFKRNIFCDTKSPYKYLTSLGKMFNWKFEIDRYDNKVNIYSHCNYFKDKQINISKSLDYKSYSVLPTISEYNNMNFNLQVTEDTYANNIWNAKYPSEYGKLVFNTGYEFNKETKDVIDDVIFTQTTPWKLTSVFFNNEYEANNRQIKPFMGAKYFITLWDKESTDGESLETKFNGLLYYGKVNQNKSDSTVKICNFDKEYGNVDTDELIVLYDSKSTSEQAENTYYVSDNIPSTSQLNDNNCYIYAKDKDVVLDIMSGRTGKAAIVTKKIPVFNNHFYNTENKSYYWINYGISNNDMTYDKKVNNYSLFDLCWFSYINDVYSHNNKICKIKYRMTEHPYDAMKHFYMFDNSIWALNTITNYKPGYARFTDCEFIKVQNKNNYML